MWHYIDFYAYLLVFITVILAAINVYSVRLAARIQIIFTFTKLVALAIIIIGGIVKLCQGTLLQNSIMNMRAQYCPCGQIFT